MSDRQINQLNQREADSSPDFSGQPEPTGWQDAIARFFKFQNYRTTIRTEVIAGITTFMTMAYILAVNPNILIECHFFATATGHVGTWVIDPIPNSQFPIPNSRFPIPDSPFPIPLSFSIVGNAWGFKAWKLG